MRKQINLLNPRTLNEWPFIVLAGRFEWCILQYFREYILKLNTAGTVCCRYSGLVVIPTCGCHRSGNGQGKNSSSSAKSEGISLRVREILIL